MKLFNFYNNKQFYAIVAETVGKACDYLPKGFESYYVMSKGETTLSEGITYEQAVTSTMFLPVILLYVVQFKSFQYIIGAYSQDHARKIASKSCGNAVIQSIEQIKSKVGIIDHSSI